MRIYRPHRAQGAIVWLHGGGFVMGDLETEHPWAVRIANGSGAVVISVGYRRAPEHRFPAALDDAYAALAWTAEHAAELGIDPERIAVGGHAAGAGLAAAVALAGTRRAGAADPLPAPQPARARRPAGDVVGAALHRHAVHDARRRSPHRGGTTWAPRPPRRTPPRRGPPICPACPPPTSPPRSSTRTATRPSPTRCGCCRRACRSSCTSGPARSTGRRRSCPPRCRSGRSPNSAPPCAVPYPERRASDDPRRP